MIFFSSPYPTCAEYGCPYLCKNTGQSSCTWKKVDGPDSFKTDRVYYLMVEANNTLGRARTDFIPFETEYLGMFWFKFSVVVVGFI